MRFALRATSLSGCDGRAGGMKAVVVVVVLAARTAGEAGGGLGLRGRTREVVAGAGAMYRSEALYVDEA